MTSRSADSLDILRSFAPGTGLRAAVDLILRQGTGALVLIGSGPEVDAVCSGGFALSDATFTAQRLAELAKMDGGIVVSPDAAQIVRANVHFNPDASILTSETGTRFRTAERLARQTACPVLSVSEEGRSVAIVYTNGDRYELRSPASLYAQANQTLNSIERLRRRLQEAEDRLGRLEVEDVVIVRDVAMLIQRAALVHRLYGAVENTVVELGGEAQLITIQAVDLMEGVDDLAEVVYADYGPGRRSKKKTVFDRLEEIPTEDLYDTARVAMSLGLGSLDGSARPRGVRLLAGIPRLPESVKNTLIRHFRDFQALLVASVQDLDDVDGVGMTRAKQLRTYFDRVLQFGAIEH